MLLVTQFCHGLRVEYGMFHYSFTRHLLFDATPLYRVWSIEVKFLTRIYCFLIKAGSLALMYLGAICYM